jgi:rRNA maturation protein Rpf1
MAIITTSRNAGETGRAHARELCSHTDCTYFNRAGKSLLDVIEHARYEGETKVLVVTEEKGAISSYQIIRISPSSFAFSERVNTEEELKHLLKE